MDNLLEIEPFKREDQEEARDLILVGLGEHFGWIDESANPDIDDIETSFTEGLFLCAWFNDEIVGTGAYIPETGETVRIVRMSTKPSFRRRGIGQHILGQLLDTAKRRGYKKAVLETTETWNEVIAFYKRYG